MSRFGKYAASLAFVAALTVGHSERGRAGQVILSDPLTSWPLNFGPQSQNMMMRDGAFHIVVQNGASMDEPYSGFSFKDMDASVTITAKANKAGDAGLMFWASAPTDYFFFGVSDVYGTFAIFHHTAANGGAWQSIVPWMKDPSIKTGPGAANTLRLISKGNSIALSINGTSIGRLSVMAPATGGTVGLIGESSGKDTSDYVFSNLTVSQ